MFTKIHLMLPTYKRVYSGKLLKFLMSAWKTASDVRNIYLTVLINEDDEETETFFKVFPMPFPTYIVRRHVGLPHMGDIYNQLYNETIFNGEYDLVSMVGDDMVFTTPDWDIIILDKINEIDGVGIVYCDDDYVQHEVLCVNMFTSRKYVKLTGLPFMPNFKGEYLDNYWMDIGKMYGGCHYLQNVVIRHEHAAAIACREDETYLRMRSNPTDNLTIYSGLMRTVRTNLINNGVIL